MSLKKRSQLEIKAIVKDFMSDVSLCEIAKKYGASEAVIYRIVQKAHGYDEYVEFREKKLTRLKKLEKSLKQKDQEIALLKGALKKL